MVDAVCAMDDWTGCSWTNRRHAGRGKGRSLCGGARRRGSCCVGPQRYTGRFTAWARAFHLFNSLRGSQAAAWQRTFRLPVTFTPESDGSTLPLVSPLSSQLPPTDYTFTRRFSTMRRDLNWRGSSIVKLDSFWQQGRGVRNWTVDTLDACSRVSVEEVCVKVGFALGV